MKKSWKELAKLGCFVPAIFVAVCYVQSLSAYTSPEYKGKVVVQNKAAQNKNASAGEWQIGEKPTEAETANGTEQEQKTKTGQTEEQTTKRTNRKNITLPAQTAMEKELKEETGGAKQTNVVQTAVQGYKDGIYYGEGTGFGGTTKVKVVVKQNKIKQIVVLETADDEPFFGRARELLKQIVEKQTVAVDTVSGATYSSNGLIEAVKNALENATLDEKKSGTSKKTTGTTKKKKSGSNQKKESSVSNTQNTGSTEFPYKDGVYFGTGEGYRGEITVAIIIENQKLQYALVTKSEDDEKFFTRAKELVKTVVEKQSTKVDVVSGATYSSKGILEAIENARNEAKKAAGITTKENETSSAATEPATTTGSNENQSNSNETKYKDGVYQVEEVCEPDSDQAFFAYQVSAKITITGGKLKNISDVTGFGADYIDEDEWYLSRALNGTKKIAGILSQGMNKGNTEGIDVVSGATCSSKTLIRAIQKAFEMADSTGK